jgi:hypothetical protein
MRRLHLYEIHEQPWCPAEIRDGATDCLRAIATFTEQYRFVLPLLRQGVEKTGAPCIVDLCSGGAGPWLNLAPRLQKQLGRPVTVVLTDLFPNWQGTISSAAASGDGETGSGDERRALPRANVVYVPFVVDATQVPAALPGFRTLFTAFHHFDEDTARAILQSAVDEGQGIAIFEQTRRSFLALAVMLLLPLLAALVTPFLRPLTWQRLFWTYVLPAIPLVLMHDGIVSCLRTYEPHELRELVEGIDGRAYAWQIGRVRSPLSPIGVTYLAGWPNK